MINLWLFRLCRASWLRAKLVEAFSHKHRGWYVDEESLWYSIGVYETRVFGICFIRSDKSCDRLVDELKRSARKTKQEGREKV